MKWFWWLIGAIVMLGMFSRCSEEKSARQSSRPNLSATHLYPSEDRNTYEERQEEAAGDYGIYRGSNCTVDCSGHDAGYNWAIEQGIDNPDDCGGRSWSFIEGCQQAATEATE